MLASTIAAIILQYKIVSIEDLEHLKLTQGCMLIIHQKNRKINYEAIMNE